MAQVTVIEIKDRRIVDAVMEEAWETVKDDSPVTFADYEPLIDEDNRWFASYENKELIALFYVHRLNLIMWQIHIQFRPQYWGKGYSTKHGKAILDRIWSDTGCKKLYAVAPDYAKQVIALAKRTGFKQEGRTKKAFQKDGVVYDQIHLGVYR